MRGTLSLSKGAEAILRVFVLGLLRGACHECREIASLPLHFAQGFGS